MNSQTVEITSAGIRKILNKYTPERAIAEYVWNGFAGMNLSGELHELHWK